MERLNPDIPTPTTTLDAATCAWCQKGIRYGESRAEVLIDTGTSLMPRGPFHTPDCLARFQAARAQILRELGFRLN